MVAKLYCRILLDLGYLSQGDGEIFPAVCLSSRRGAVEDNNVNYCNSCVKGPGRFHFNVYGRDGGEDEESS